jgi:hypothetical protein
MKFILQAQGYDVWQSVVSRYTTTKKPPKTATKKELKRNNKIEMDFILEGLCDSFHDKVGQCSSSKELWDKLQNLCSNKYLPVIENTKHVDQDKEYVELEREERSSLGKTDLEEEYYEEARLISALDELMKEIKKNKLLK